MCEISRFTRNDELFYVEPKISLVVVTVRQIEQLVKQRYRWGVNLHNSTKDTTMRCKDRVAMESEQCAFCNREVDPDDHLMTRTLNHGFDSAHRACLEQALRDGRAFEIPPAYARFHTASPNKR